VPTGKISFNRCGEKIDFYFPSPLVSPMLTRPLIPSVHGVSAASIPAMQIEEIGRDSMPQGRLFAIIESASLLSSSFGGIIDHPEEG